MAALQRKALTAQARPRTLLDHRRGFEGHWPELRVGEKPLKPRGEYRVLSIYEMISVSQLEQVAIRGKESDFSRVEVFSGVIPEGFADIIRTTRNGVTVTEIRTC